MKQEEKDLLLKDLCARLPYGVRIRIRYCDLQRDCDWVEKDTEITCNNVGYCADGFYSDFKPYLRPMSSMTEKERAFYAILINTISETQDMNHLPKRCEYMFNWLRANHFDYNGLIEKGLALEAPADMYKTK